MASSENAGGHKITYLRDYRAPSFAIPETRLEFDLEPECTTVKSVMHFKRISRVDGTGDSGSLVLQGEELELLYVRSNSKLLAEGEDYRVDQEQGNLEIFKVPDEFDLEIAVKVNPVKNTTCSGLYLSSGIFCTQNEPHGFRKITYFLDRPDVLTKITTVIRADAERYPTLLSNGNMLEYRVLEHGKHQTIWQDPFNKSCYLFALVAGKLGCLEGSHRTPSGREVQLRIYALPERVAQAQFAMQSLKRAMEWDEESFGLECDLDLYQIVAIDDFNFGAMENKGLNIFNSEMLLASADNATDSDWRNIARVVAHEYFHNWTGNRVTCRDWFQIGLKEGLTTLREQLFMEDVYGVAYRIDSARFIREVQFKEDAGPLSHPVRLSSYLEVNNFYTATVYEKGAELFRMLLTLIGREEFKQVVREFLKQMDGQAATISDFWRIAAQVARFHMNEQIDPSYKLNIAQLEDWYDRMGTPKLSASSRIGEDNKLEISFRRQESKAEDNPLIIPVEIEILDPVQEKTQKEMLLLTKEQEVFHLPAADSLATNGLVVSYLSGFSAPVALQDDNNAENLLLIVKLSKDPVSRYLAMQELVTRALDSLMSLGAVTESAIAPVIEGYGVLLAQVESAGELVVRALAVPSVSYLAEIFADRFDLLSIDQAVRRLQKLLGEKLYDRWLELYHYSRRDLTTEYSIEDAQCRLRALSRIALHYLVGTGNEGAVALAKEQLKRANNLTDRYAVLSSGVYWQLPEAHSWLADCYQNWSQDEQLFPKWLALKGRLLAASDEAGWQAVFEDVNFSWCNPNKVLALLRGFCAGNLAEFHATDGRGYALITRAVLKLDGINPQIAALLAKSLTSVRGLLPEQVAQLRCCWKKLLAASNLSVNVYELIDKAVRADKRAEGEA